MLLANMIVDAFAALGCMAFLLVVGGSVVASALARSGAVKALLDERKKPRRADAAEAEETE